MHVSHVSCAQQSAGAGLVRVVRYSRASQREGEGAGGGGGQDAEQGTTEHQGS